MNEDELKEIRMQIAHFKDLAATFYKQRPYIQVEDEDVIYKHTIGLFEKMYFKFKEQQEEIKDLKTKLKSKSNNELKESDSLKFKERYIEKSRIVDLRDSIKDDDMMNPSEQFYYLKLLKNILIGNF